ncbi:MAG: VanZ family protein [Desulfovibrionales bacterium]|nr:VanZ family protein [Desulfovibrionales bacterium]
MRSTISRRLHTSIWGVYLAALVIFSLLPSFIPPGPENSDKFMHLAAYSILTCLWPESILQSPCRRFLAAAGLGVVLECGQGILPTGRFADVSDAVANGLGAGIGLFVQHAMRGAKEGARGKKTSGREGT